MFCSFIGLDWNANDAPTAVQHGYKLVSFIPLFNFMQDLQFMFIILNLLPGASVPLSSLPVHCSVDARCSCPSLSSGREPLLHEIRP